MKRSSLWLPLALIIISGPMNNLWADFKKALFLIVAIQCWGMACTLVNDLSDKEEDSAAGKKRWANNLSANAGVFIFVFFTVIGFISILFTGGSAGAVTAYAAVILIGIFYSLRPVRLKDRGLLGISSYGLFTAIAYVLVPWMSFDIHFGLLIPVFIALFMDKWVNLHFHQILDYQADLDTGSRTYAVKVGLERTRGTLQIAAVLASSAMVVVLIYIIVLLEQKMVWRVLVFLLAFSVVGGVGIYAKKLKRRAENISDLLRELPWIYLGLTYLLFRVLPPFLFTYLAIREPVMWILVALSSLSLLGESLYSIRYRYE
ncbi:UbiA family prenyltransferase [Thermodesulfobacteriota bacterium]